MCPQAKCDMNSGKAIPGGVTAVGKDLIQGSVLWKREWGVQDSLEILVFTLEVSF